eukprot:GHVT01066139.1.p1 GENE.GHVT01066139.1~~GHVT01066139.1.p1  ORF type:complete len:116 (-),score=28.74 GHVT01066139.1:303-650(-)
MQLVYLQVARRTALRSAQSEAQVDGERRGAFGFADLRLEGEHASCVGHDLGRLINGAASRLEGSPAVAYLQLPQQHRQQQLGGGAGEKEVEASELGVVGSAQKLVENWRPGAVAN